MNLKKVKRLHPGDRIGLTAPAGPVCSEMLQAAVCAMIDMGFEVEVGETCQLKYRSYLAGVPERRAEELNNMFGNPKIKGIFCLRGGYGSPQILPLLDEGLIRKNPKLFIGYSDITALHIFLQQRCGLPSVHGPMPASDLISADPYTKESLLRILMDPSPLGPINNPPGEMVECLIPGKASGVMTGGNLSLITSLMGTPFEIHTKGKILFLEEVNEEPYKLDRMMTQLALAGKLSDAEGFVLGSWTGCEGTSEVEKANISDLMKELLSPYGKPILLNLRAGHCQPMVSLPFGVYAELDATAGRLVVHESFIK